MIDTKALAARDAARVLIVSSAECARAAARTFPPYVVVDYQPKDRANLDPLRGRSTDIWLDAGLNEEAAKLAQLLLSLDCTVRAVNPNGAAPGWNIATAVAGGMKPPELLAYARSHITEVKKPAAAPAEVAKFEPVDRLPPKSQRPPTELKHGEDVSSTVLNQQSWGLQFTRGGLVACNVANVLKALKGAEDAGKRVDVWYDTLGDRLAYSPPGQPTRDWRKTDTTDVTVWLQTEAGMLNLQSNTVIEAVTKYASGNQRNEVVEFIDNMRDLGWDGTPRLSELMHKGFGAEENEYTAAVGRCFIMGMVARAVDPGCQLDYVPVFEGVQGAGKSTALRVIGGRFFSEVHESVLKKDFFISLQGIWLAEIAEMDSFRRAENARVKGVITDRKDRYRDMYGTGATNHPRRCVFACTTNKTDWNTDETGARRFWPIRCGKKVDLAWLDENRMQLFAEAVYRYDARQSYHDVPIEAALLEQADRQQGDVWDEQVAAHIEREKEVAILWVMERMQLKATDQSPGNTQRIAAILRRLGWDNKRVRNGKKVLWRWHPPSG